MALLRPIGWIRMFDEPARLEAALAQAEVARRDYGVNFNALDSKALAAAEPHLMVERSGAIRIGRGRIEVIDRPQLARRLARGSGG